jgi:predicted DNA repair protein MutK
VWAVCKGSLVNKAILVPAAMLISAFAPWLITPLLMVGGAFLCFEGVEKLAHRWLHPADEDDAHHAELTRALADPAVDLVALESDKIKGAIRTDFILSAEIIAIALGAVASQPLSTQAGVLTLVAVVMTVGVYGLVAGIVKMDDAGLYLCRQTGEGAGTRLGRSLGQVLLSAAPKLMKLLAVAGTAAMFLVGGGILVHGWPWLHHGIEALLVAVPALLHGPAGLLADAVVGIVAGAVVLAGVLGVQRLRGSH